MNSTISRIFLPLIIFCALTTSFARSDSLQKRTRIELGIGFWYQGSSVTSEIDISGVQTTLDAGGPLGWIGISHWISERVSLTGLVSFNSVGLQSKVGILGVENYTASVSSILFGCRYYPFVDSVDSKTRFYVAGSVGRYAGEESAQKIGLTGISITSKSASAFGGNLSVGLDTQLSHRFMLGFNGGYNFMSDFSEPIGGQVNLGGSYFGVSISYLFGK